MDRLLGYILVIYFLLSLVAFGEWYKCKKEKKLRELIAWAATGDNNRSSYTWELVNAIRGAQCSDAIDAKYRISDDAEWKYVREIIEEYQKDLMRSYFKGKTISVKSKDEMYGNEYFMFTLGVFLSDHQYDHEFMGYYLRSDFGTVFFKLHYIAYMYCENNEKLTSKVGYWTKNELRQQLDARLK